MDGSVQKYFQLGLAPSTQKTYHAAMKRFHSFCCCFNVTNPFPVTEQLLCSFVAYLADDGLAPQTCKSYLAAVRNMQISLGLPDPRAQSSLPILKRVQAGISRARILKGAQSRIRLPITAHILGRIQELLLASSNPEKNVVWTIACIAFFGFFRLGELLPTSARSFTPATHLCWGDVAVDSLTSPSMVQVHLKISKCDQVGRGVDIVMGRTGRTVCPVSAIVSYLQTRQDCPGAFFLLSTGSIVTKPWFVEQIRSVLTSLGLPQDDYAGHSFRIGAATTAAQKGLEDSTIKTLGRWQSSAFLQYIRTPKERLASLSASLAT